MLDKSIDGALLALRKRIIREGGKGLEHVEALLALRGVPAPRVLPPKRRDVAKRGETRRVLLGALRSGPRTLAELVDVVQAWKPDVPARLAYGRTAQALYKMQAAGLVGHEGRLWGLTLGSGAPTSDSDIRYGQASRCPSEVPERP